MSTMIAKLRASTWERIWRHRPAADHPALDRAAKRLLAEFAPTLIASRAEYLDRAAENAALEQLRRRAFQECIGSERPILTKGYCYPCRAWRMFTTPAGPARPGGTVTPNWRESLICPGCGMNSRMRASLHLFEHFAQPRSDNCIYVTEQVTALYHWLESRYPHAIGSEFLRDGTRRGTTNAAGIRHEDMTALSFADGSIDHIVSLEVLEHVPDFRRALTECARVLKPGGSLVLTAPFHRGERHLVRARLRDDATIEHIEPPEYHGDPVNPEGCLCFYHFGWELLDDLRAAGFRRSSACVFWSRDLCYTDGGGESIQFLAQR